MSRHRNSHRVELGVPYTQKRSNGCVSRGYFQVPVLRHSRQNSGLLRRYREDDLLESNYFSSVNPCRKVEFIQNKMMKDKLLTVRHFVYEKVNFFQKCFSGQEQSKKQQMFKRNALNLRDRFL